MNEEIIKALDERNKIERRLRKFQDFQRELDRTEMRDLREALMQIEKYLVDERGIIN